MSAKPIYLNILDQSNCSSKPLADATKAPLDFQVETRNYVGKAAVITLGCAKNQVDSEVILGTLTARGFEIVTDVNLADVAIVNTCGFLESAVAESIDCILDIADLKKTGRLRKLIVAGCMVSRYKGSLAETLPEVDAFISLDDLLQSADVASGANGSDFLEGAARPYFLYDDSMPRVVSTRTHTAYVKVSEGCNRPCTFCIIPKIRGNMRSRKLESVVREVSDLASQGVKEVNLVAQDLTSYGQDLKGPSLSELLVKLDATEINWIRLLYAYPIGVCDELLDAIIDLPSVCEYFDIPLQHSSEKILKPMKRPLGQFSPRALVERIKTRQPEIALRTTFIVGFPGETEQDISDLENFVREGYFSSVGVFVYSPEEGTPAYQLDGQISEEEKNVRKERIMLAQKEVLDKKLQNYVGKELEVLVEGLHADTDLIISARSRFQAPDVDANVLINDLEAESEKIEAGKLAKVRISEVAGYDLVGSLLALNS